MTDKDRNEIRRHLVRLVEESGTLPADVRGEPCADELDAAAQLVRHHLAVALGERSGLRRREAEAALKRLDSPDFGLCVQCGEEIPVNRLKARPAAILCVDCQEERDRRLGACA